MTTFDIMLVQQTFAQIAPVADLVADLFFARLFQLDPTLRVLFPNDLRSTKMRLMRALAQSVREIQTAGDATSEIAALGRRHLGYGVQPKHYQTFGEALLWTLEKGLGEGFTFETRQAWQRWYAQLVRVMQSPGAISVPEHTDRHIETQI
jgi:hemoglobin-like flavoprotein